MKPTIAKMKKEKTRRWGKCYQKHEQLLKAFENLKDVTNIQCSKGNWDYDEYMRGMANGLILAMSCFTGKEPKYFNPIKKP